MVRFFDGLGKTIELCVNRSQIAGNAAGKPGVVRLLGQLFGFQECCERLSVGEAPELAAAKAGKRPGLLIIVACFPRALQDDW